MHITLEMVDEIINRTGVTYRDAKEALEACDGDLLKALVYIEDGKLESAPKQSKKLDGQEIVNKLKAMVNEGLVTQITIERKGKVLLDIPVVAGAVTAVIFSFATVAAIIAAVATGCTISIVKKDGEIININEFTQEKFDSIFKSAKKAAKENDDCNAEERYASDDKKNEATKPEDQDDDWYESHH
jgi:hypothetical protein